MNKYFNLQKYKEFLIKTLREGRTSYSQTGEDLILSLFFSNKRDGFYVDVGANHPKRFNNSFLFYKRGWRGVNIEPNPLYFSQFEIFRRKDINLNVGVGRLEGKSVFYIFKEDALSTFSDEISERYRAMGHELKEKRVVPRVPLSSILDEYAGDRHIDFLTVDTEGSDLEVLESNNWKKYRPKFIIIESIEYQKDGFGLRLNYDSYFNERGYRKVADTYINNIYVDADACDEFGISKKGLVPMY